MQNVCLHVAARSSTYKYRCLGNLHISLRLCAEWLVVTSEGAAPATCISHIQLTNNYIRYMQLANDSMYM